MLNPQKRMNANSGNNKDGNLFLVSNKARYTVQDALTWGRRTDGRTDGRTYEGMNGHTPCRDGTTQAD